MGYKSKTIVKKSCSMKIVSLLIIILMFISISPILIYISSADETNSPPDPPSNPNPGDGEIDVGVNKVLSWTCSDPDGDTLTYEVYFSTNDPPGSVGFVTSEPYNPGIMNYGTTYYWKIVAIDFQKQTEGPTWEFTTSDTEYERYWDDQFNNRQNIDQSPPGSGMSDNYEVSDGKAKMSDTYAAWTDPNWEQMRIIQLTNSGEETYNYELYLNPPTGTNMGDKFKDIRFKRESDTDWLPHCVESSSITSANVWLDLLEIGSYSDNEIFMFYANDQVNDVSNFFDVFDEGWQTDFDEEKITNLPDRHGANNPDVCHGNEEFLITWNEGQIWWKYYGVWFGVKKHAYAIMIDDETGDTIGSRKKLDNDIEGPLKYYKNSNPSVAYGDDKWFVAWEHYNDVTYWAGGDPDSIDIYVRILKRTGDSLSYHTSLDNLNGDYLYQGHPCVVYDSVNEQFCVVYECWENLDYNLHLRLFDTDGVEIKEKKLDSEEFSEDQLKPSIVFDKYNKRYCLVWEDAPFQIKLLFLDEALDPISPVSNPIIISDDEEDCRNPCVEFCEEEKSYFVTWEVYDQDLGRVISVEGNMVDENGDPIVMGLENIREGDFSQTNIVPFMKSNFFVAYHEQDDGEPSDEIWGNLVNSSSDDVLNYNFLMYESDGDTASNLDMAVANDDRILITWEDNRDYNYPWDDLVKDIYYSIWYLYINSSDIDVSYGEEKDKILNAYITSNIIDTIDFVRWGDFTVEGTETNKITFKILTEEGDFITSIEPGPIPESVNNYETIRLMATFERTNPSYTPTIDYWKISYISSSGGSSQDELDVTIDYNNSKPIYRGGTEGDKVRIFANFSNSDLLQDPIQTFVTIEDVTGYLIVNKATMTLLNSNSECPQCDWYYDWTVNSASEAADGVVTVNISVETVQGYEVIAIKDPSYDDSKEIDNTPPVIYGTEYFSTGWRSVTVMCSIEVGCYAVLEWGEDTGYGSITPPHSGGLPEFYLSNLGENKTYHYKITAFDSAGNSIETEDHTFRTGNFSSNEDMGNEENPIAEAGGPYEGFIGEPVVFDGSDSKKSINGKLILYKWDFDEDNRYDNISFDGSATHTYYKNGEHNVTLLIHEHPTNKTDTDTAVVTIAENNTVELENLTKDNTSHVEITGATDTIVVYIEIIPTRDLSNVAINTRDYGAAKPSNIIKEPNIEDLKEEISDKKTENISIYRYVDIALITNDNNAYDLDIKSAEILFKIEQEWIENNNIDKDSIVLLRYHNNRWQKLNTTHIGSPPEKPNSFFLSETPGFSTFAVVGSKVVEKGETLDKPEDDPIPWIIIFGFIISAIVILIFILFKTKLIYIEDVETAEKE